MGAYRAYAEGGWIGLAVPAEWGGQGLPYTLAAIVNTFSAAANMSFTMYPGLTQTAIAAIARHAPHDVKRLLLPAMARGAWSGTMNLTESHCGTDLGLLKTKAVKASDGSYRISGQKIFISAGEHDLCDNIVHLVLARIEGAPSGTKGISLFVVPKIEIEPDGSLSARNGVSCGSIEHKMGIHGNATCVMNYDGARGWLIGEENRGLNAMFVMMNEARLGVAAQGLALSDVAYQNAVAYARERLQGRALSGAKSPDRPADPIIVHPDVRRMLLTIRAFNEAACALLVYASLQADIVRASADEAERAAAEDRLGLLTPVLKGVLTDGGFENAVLAQQIFGGHGYIAETGVEQFVRDARIAMIYEGANGIQALDLIGRKLPKDGGRAMQAFLEEIALHARQADEEPTFKAVCGLFAGVARASAASHAVARSKRAGQPGRRGRGVLRLHAPPRTRGPRLHVAAHRRRGPGARRSPAERRSGRGDHARQARRCAVFLRAPAAGNGASLSARVGRIQIRYGIGRKPVLSGRPNLSGRPVRNVESRMPDAFIFDAVRTPRGRGKPDGSLHEVSTLGLATAALSAIKERNGLEPTRVDDVVLGCVDPVGEAGGDIARAAALTAGYGASVPGVQINRFCASGLDAVNFAAAQIMAGQHDMTIGGGVESMSRVGLGASGGAWPVDPAIAIPSYFMPQGVSADLIATKYGFSRTDVDAYAAQSQKRAAAAWSAGRFERSVIPVTDINGLTILARDEHLRPETTMQSLAALKPSFQAMAEQAGFAAVALQAASGRRASGTRSSRRQFLGHRGWSGRGPDRKRRGWPSRGTDAARQSSRLRKYRLGSSPDAHRSDRGDAKNLAQSGNAAVRHRSDRNQRGFRRRCAAVPASLRCVRRAGQRQRRRDLRSVILSARRGP